MKTSQFDYKLPANFIAQTPIEPRYNSRLMVVKRGSNEVEHVHFYELGDFLKKCDLLVINRTRVLPARIHAYKPTGGKVEILLLRKIDEQLWETLVGGKGIKEDMALTISSEVQATVVETLAGSRRLIRFTHPIDTILKNIGEMPLPPYIHEPLSDPERYQTIYADRIGSAAAPTAGLHFTEELMTIISNKGIQFAEVTLHVGLDTFAPVNEDDPHDHAIHQEWCEVTPQTAELINQTHQLGGRVIAVGTTTVRTLESAYIRTNTKEIIGPYCGMTDLFILPGFKFHVVDAMITNFHLPRSTLLMLVSAFSSWQEVKNWYEIGIKEKYRFYSFGDAMLIL